MFFICRTFVVPSGSGYHKSQHLSRKLRDSVGAEGAG